MGAETRSSVAAWLRPNPPNAGENSLFSVTGARFESGVCGFTVAADSRVLLAEPFDFEDSRPPCFARADSLARSRAYASRIANASLAAASRRSDSVDGDSPLAPAPAVVVVVVVLAPPVGAPVPGVPVAGVPVP